MTKRALKLLPALLILSVCVGGHGAPFAKRIVFVQPDGTRIELFGRGDEFYAVFETLEGYTVIFDDAARAYCYARLSNDECALVSTGVQVQSAAGQALELQQHLRIGAEAVRRQVAQRRRAWEAVTRVSEGWQALKSRNLGQAPTGLPAPPPSPTVGMKRGLCLLIDFDDDPAAIPQAEIANFCNGDSYTGYGNNGSVKQYFFDNAKGALTYSNVVTVYIRIPNSLHPKSWYNDPTQDYLRQGNLLIRDAIQIMKSLPNYQTEILPTFSPLTVDANNQLVACNVFYAGENSGVWIKGLWPHCGALVEVGAQELAPGNKQVYLYQITDIGSQLTLGTFVHENGHMLCRFPDIYDYDGDSEGGAGVFCLMNYGCFGGNPAQVCAYFKMAAGWATATTLDGASSLQGLLCATPGPVFNHFYRYANPGSQTEYFLLECRHRVGRDADLPTSGIAAWHIDELGDNCNQSLVPNSTHANYEVTLVQADNRWDFEYNRNDGDVNDLYYSGNNAAGYANVLSDSSAPAARWWDGSASGISFHGFSAPGPAMTFCVGTPPLRVGPASQDFGLIQAGTTADRTFYVTNTSSGTLSGGASVTLPFSVISGATYTLGAYACQAVVVRYAPTGAGTNTAIVTLTGGAGATCLVSGAAYGSVAYHSADYQAPRWFIDGSEVSRVLAYWRAGAYHLEAGGLDGYAPGLGSTNGARHSADYQGPDWAIDGTEVNRVLSYWRAGGYHPDPAGLDGYAPGTNAAGLPLRIQAAQSPPRLPHTFPVSSQEIPSKQSKPSGAAR
jgi:M6 family metalloprotease-like protein